MQIVLAQRDAHTKYRTPRKSFIDSKFKCTEGMKFGQKILPIWKKNRLIQKWREILTCCRSCPLTFFTSSTGERAKQRSTLAERLKE